MKKPFTVTVLLILVSTIFLGTAWSQVLPGPIRVEGISPFEPALVQWVEPEEEDQDSLHVLTQGLSEEDQIMVGEDWDAFWALLDIRGLLQEAPSLGFPARDAAYWPSSGAKLIKGDRRPEVYVVYKARKYWIPNPVTFEALGWKWGNIRVYPQVVVNLIPKGANLPRIRWGFLIKGRGSPKVYLAWRGKWYIKNERTVYDMRGTSNSGYSPWAQLAEFPSGVLSTVQTRGTLDSATWPRCKSGYPGHCTRYVQERRRIPPWDPSGARSGNAMDWFRNAYYRYGPKYVAPGKAGRGFLVACDVNKPPVNGCVMCFGPARSNGYYGHVALVEAVDYRTQSVLIAHRWVNSGGVRRQWVDMWGRNQNWGPFQGYIF